MIKLPPTPPKMPPAPSDVLRLWLQYLGYDLDEALKRVLEGRR